jgi:hypothetical protein
MRKVAILIMMILFATKSNAGWFGLTKDAPKEITAKEKAMIKDAICGCDMGSQSVYARTVDQANYEKAVRPLMIKINIALRKQYAIKGSVQCNGWAAYSMIPKGRKVCMSTYENYGDDRSLKTEIGTLR